MTVALIAFTFTWIRLPETKGRTFDDIAEEFRGAEGIPLHNNTGFNTFTWLTFQPLLKQIMFILLEGQFAKFPNIFYQILVVCNQIVLVLFALFWNDTPRSGSFNKQCPSYSVDYSERKLFIISGKTFSKLESIKNKILLNLGELTILPS